MKTVLILITLFSLSMLVACSNDGLNEDGEVKGSAESEEEYVDDFDDGYKEIEATVIIEEGSHFWVSNTDSETLADELQRLAEMGDPYELKETDEGRILYSIEGVANDESNAWKVYSESCEGGQECPDNLDEIVLKGGVKFVIIYLHEDDDFEI